MNKFTFYFLNHYKSFITLSIVAISFTICYYRKKCHEITFDNINKNYKKKYG